MIVTANHFSLENNLKASTISLYDVNSLSRAPYAQVSFMYYLMSGIQSEAPFYH
jgi:hypothetical protein